MEDPEVQLVRPPVPVRRASAGRVRVVHARYRGLAFFHKSLLLSLCEFLSSATVNTLFAVSKIDILISPLYNPDKAHKGIFEDGGSYNLTPAPSSGAIPDRETPPHR